MSRRIRRRSSLFPWPARLVHPLAPAALAIMLGAALAGCAHDDTPRNVNGSRMDRDELLVHGDDMKMEGLKLKNQGTTIGDDAMVQRGETLISQGQQLIDKASAMPKEQK